MGARSLLRVRPASVLAALALLLTAGILGAQRAQTIQTLPDPDVLDAEGSGSYVPGSFSSLASGLASSGTFSWELVGYETTEFPCTDLVFTSVPGSKDIGSFGQCGVYDARAALPVTSGSVLDEVKNKRHSGAYGLRVPAGTTTVEVLLSSGTVVHSLPALSGAWVAVWDGSATIVHVSAVGVGGVTIHRCTQECANP